MRYGYGWMIWYEWWVVLLRLTLAFTQIFALNAFYSADIHHRLEWID
jgi:hypothetical protein